MALAAGGGCGRDAAAPSPRPVYVSLERLAARHPLAEDLRRLGVAERDLGAVTAAEQVGAASAYALQRLTLPPLPVTDRDGERERLSATAETHLAGFIERYRVQQERALRRERLSQEAATEAALVRQRRVDEDEVYRQIQETRAENGARLTNLRIKIDALSEGQKYALPPRDRAHLEAQVRQFRAELQAVLDEDLEAERIARAAARERQGALARRLKEEDDQAIAALRAQANRVVDRLVEVQRAALSEDMARLAMTPSLGSESVGTYTVTPTARLPVDDRISTRAAREQLGRQRERLRQLVLADVRAAVYDAAAERDLTVRLTPAAGVPDETARFADWITRDGTIRQDR